MNSKQEKALTERALDPELLAMRRIHRLLSKLPQAAAARVLRYVNDRFTEPHQAELPLDGKEGA